MAIELRRVETLDEGQAALVGAFVLNVLLYSTERCLQFYGGKVLDGSLVGKSGRPYERHGALCLECQGFPDGPNHPEIEDIFLRPGETYQQKTRYVFSAE